jgi:hypothetical protein
LVFGSWTIVTGKRHERIKISWDGRDGFLTVEQTTAPDSRPPDDWVNVKTEGIDVRNYTDAFNAAERFLKVKFIA